MPSSSIDELQPIWIHPDNQTTDYVEAMKNYSQPNYLQARKHLESAIEKQETLPNSSHSDTIKIKNSLGILHLIMANYSRAMDCFAYANAACTIGKDMQACIAAISNNTGIAYHCQGKHNEVLTWLQRALDNYGQSLGGEHKSNAAIYCNIAYVYNRLADYSKSLDNFQNALNILAIRKKTLESEYQSTALAYNGIAVVYCNQARYGEALETLQRALKIQEDQQEADHPATAEIYENIGGVYRAKGDGNEALLWQKKALAVRKRAFGRKHPETASSYNSIATAHHARGKNYKAKALKQYSSCKALMWHKKALTVEKKLRGQDHPIVATYYDNIAQIYLGKGRCFKARRLCKKSIVLREKTLGTKHPRTAHSYLNMAWACYGRSQNFKAKDWARKALIIQEKMLGSNHPSTALCYNMLALIYARNYYHAEALKLFLDAFCVLFAKAGPAHSNTLIVRKNMMNAYERARISFHVHKSWDEWLEDIEQSI